MEQVKGYTYGGAALDKSPVSLQDLELLKKTLLWSEDDENALRKAGSVLESQIDDILDVWYGYVGSNEHLLYYFTKNGSPDMAYLGAVRARFGQWIQDVCQRPHDQDWLNYQHEIAKRHHSVKKNVTDGVDSVPIIHYRYMTAFIFPITVTIKSFLGHQGHTPAEVESMYNAWFKAITLSVILWTYPYINHGEF